MNTHSAVIERCHIYLRRLAHSFSGHKRMIAFVAVSLFFAMQTLTVSAQPKATKKLEILSPIASAKQELVAAGGAVKIVYKVNDEDIDSVRFKIDAPPYESTSGSADFKRESPHVFTAKLFKGRNTIQLFGFHGSDAIKSATALIVIQCSDECGGSDPQKPRDEPPAGRPGARNIKIVKPEGSDAVTDVKSVDRTIVVEKKANAGVLMIDVVNSDKSVDHQLVKKVDDATDTLGIANVTIKIAKGKNIVRVYSLDHLGEPGFQDTMEITCNGPKCAEPGEKLAATGEGSSSEPKGSVRIVSPKNKATYTDAKTVPVNITVSRNADASKNVKNLIVTVLNEGNPIIQQDRPFPVNFPDDKSKPGEIDLKALKIGKGKNEVAVFDPTRRDTEHAEIEINCEGECGGKEAANELSVAVSAPKDEQGTYQVKDVSSLDSLVRVPKGDTKKIRYDVYGPDRKSFDKTISIPDATAKAVEVPLRLEFFRGLNTIRIYDADKGGGDGDVSIMINCDGPGCASVLGLTSYSTPFTRGIIGVEQAAAASANPEQKLFLEFNLTAPLFRKKDSPLKAPLWLWLNPRITSLPQQFSSSLADFSTASNFFSPFTAGKVNEIAQGFEFTGGFEVPLKRFKDADYVTGPIPSGFGPDTKVRFGVSAIFGGGRVGAIQLSKNCSGLQC